MKQPKKMTRAHKEVLSKRGLKSETWDVLRETEVTVTVRSKKSGQIRVVMK